MKEVERQDTRKEGRIENIRKVRKRLGHDKKDKHV